MVLEQRLFSGDHVVDRISLALRRDLDVADELRDFDLLDRVGQRGQRGLLRIGGRRRVVGQLGEEVRAELDFGIEVTSLFDSRGN